MYPSAHESHLLSPVLLVLLLLLLAELVLNILMTQKVDKHIREVAAGEAPPLLIRRQLHAAQPDATAAELARDAGGKRHAAKADMTVCVSCEAGRHSNEALTRCDDCTTGRYGAASNTHLQCAQCGEGPL